MWREREISESLTETRDESRRDQETEICKRSKMRLAPKGEESYGQDEVQAMLYNAMIHEWSWMGGRLRKSEPRGPAVGVFCIGPISSAQPLPGRHTTAKLGAGGCEGETGDKESYEAARKNHKIAAYST